MGRISDYHAAQIELWMRTAFKQGIGLSYDLHLPEMDESKAWGGMFDRANVPAILKSLQESHPPILMAEHEDAVALLDEALAEVEHIRIEAWESDSGYVEYIVVDPHSIDWQRQWWNRLDAIAFNGMDSTSWRETLYFNTREDVKRILDTALEADGRGECPFEQNLRIVGACEQQIYGVAQAVYRMAIQDIASTTLDNPLHDR